MKQDNVLLHLKRNFLLIVMGMMTVLLVSAFLAINLSSQKYNDSYQLTRLGAIADRDGILPQFDGSGMMNPGHGGEFRMDAYVAVKLDAGGNIFGIISGSMGNLDVAAVSQVVDAITKQGKAAGEMEGLAYLVREKNYGYILVFMDISGQQEQENRLMALTGGIMLMLWLVILGVAIYLSRWVSRPVEKAFAAQTRFVADASHELKTPLAVINANLAVLREKPGKNQKWLDYIKEELDRMNGLTGSLLTLATMDDPAFRRNDSSFMLDKLAESCMLPFESMMYEKGIQLSMNLEMDTPMTGDMEKLEQMLRILAENAVKHTPEGGTILVEVRRKGNKKTLSVFNEGTPIPQEDLDRIFGRFYRSDFARDRQSGGYGLGLAIAKTVVDLHKGKIYAEPGLEKGARFIVELP